MKFLPQCIESTLSQDYENYEVYAYDNESTDDTVLYLESQVQLYDKLKMVSVKNVYSNSYREAFEHAFENVDTDYLTFIASDDYVSNDYVSKCMKIFAHAPTKIKCLQSELIGTSTQGFTGKQSHVYRNLEEFKNQCMIKSPVNTPTVIYHKEIYPFLKMEAHEKKELDCSGAEDYDMFCSLADNNIFIYPVPQHLGYFYRWHEDQCTWKVRQQKKSIDYDKIIQEYWKYKWGL